jgi:hypothetical protein
MRFNIFEQCVRSVLEERPMLLCAADAAHFAWEDTVFGIEKTIIEVGV